MNYVTKFVFIEISGKSQKLLSIAECSINLILIHSAQLSMAQSKTKTELKKEEQTDRYNLNMPCHFHGIESFLLSLHSIFKKKVPLKIVYSKNCLFLEETPLWVLS